MIIFNLEEVMVEVTLKSINSKFGDLTSKLVSCEQNPCLLRSWRIVAYPEIEMSESVMSLLNHVSPMQIIFGICIEHKEASSSILGYKYKIERSPSGRYEDSW